MPFNERHELVCNWGSASGQQRMHRSCLSSGKQQQGSSRIMNVLNPRLTLGRATAVEAARGRSGPLLADADRANLCSRLTLAQYLWTLSSGAGGARHTFIHHRISTSGRSYHKPHLPRRFRIRLYSAALCASLPTTQRFFSTSPARDAANTTTHACLGAIMSNSTALHAQVPTD